MTLFGEDMIKYLTSDREPMADQSADATKVQHGEPVSFIRVTYRKMGEELLTEMT